MFNKKQVSAIPEKLGLNYIWESPDIGCASIIVENSIQYKFFSNWLIDLCTNQKYHSGTFDKFCELCEELAKNKRNQGYVPMFLTKDPLL